MRQDHIVIVGAGIVGLSAAFALLQQGMKNVTVIEQHTINHEQAASHGISRLLRFEYGADQFYTEMVQGSLQRWRELEQMTQRNLYTSTGVLVLGSNTDAFARNSYDVLRNLEYPSESLSRHDLLSLQIHAGFWRERLRHQSALLSFVCAGRSSSDGL